MSFHNATANKILVVVVVVRDVVVVGSGVWLSAATSSSNWPIFATDGVGLSRC